MFMFMELAAFYETLPLELRRLVFWTYRDCWGKDTKIGRQPQKGELCYSDFKRLFMALGV